MENHATIETFCGEGVPFSVTMLMIFRSWFERHLIRMGPHVLRQDEQMPFQKLKEFNTFNLFSKEDGRL